MNPTPRTPGWYLLTRHWATLTGAALVATAGFSLLFVAPQEVRGHASNPYVGIVLFLILPFVFFAGLGLIAAGLYISKRELRESLTGIQFDRKVAMRRLGIFCLVTTLLNVLIGTQLTYRAVKHMETPQFCGATCHTMAPEFAAYQNSPHSRVECVECHVSPGAAGWVQSKTNGLRQLVQTVFHKVPKPIPSAIESGRLVPARETCENCHWPQKFGGVRLRVMSKFAEDEQNSRSETVLLMLVGGDGISGIHGAHLGPGVHIRFAPDDAARQSISRVEYRNTVTGESRSFTNGATAPKALPVVEMQCVDCHNRPTHSFDLPERALDKALAAGELPSTLPYIKKKSLEVLKTAYPSRDDAAGKLPAALVEFYRSEHPEVYARRAQDIEAAAKKVLAIYNRNVFPELGVKWGTYPNNLGHTDSPGCFRCHDGAHVSADGKAIGQDCNSCHEPLSMEETSPEILKTLGLAGRLSKLQRQ
ncbi:MAG: NapC/NirT family cytochrome c [Candidatus Solibacter sp.]